MAITEQTPRASATLATATDAIPFPYYFNANSELVVVSATNGTLVLDSGYSVTGAQVEAGGTVTMIGGTVGDTITITRDTPISQTIELNTSGPLFIDEVEAALDKQTRISQEQELKITDIEADVATNTTSIATNAANIATNTAAIAALDPTIDDTVSAIGNLSPSVNNLLAWDGSAWIEELHLLPILNGTFGFPFTAEVTSDGATVTLTVQKDPTGDLTMHFSTGEVDFDCTPAATVSLTAGTDTAPVENYVYVPISTKVLTVSTSDWPSEEHIKVCYTVLPTAGFVQTNGPYAHQVWNDSTTNGNNQGYISRMAERIRREGARYYSGIDGNGTNGYLSPTASNVEFISTAGVVYQMHKQTFPVFDTSAGDVVLVKNWSGDAYHDITNLFDITADSTGTTITASNYFNLVVWGVANDTDATYHPIVINLPSGFYATQADALADVSAYDDFSIPSPFGIRSPTAFLIARITIQIGTTWTVVQTQDLRGGSTGSGGGSVASVTQFNDSDFAILDNSDVTKKIAFQASGITTATTRTLTVQDSDGTLACTNVAQTFSAAQTFTEVADTVYAVSGTTPAIDPANGAVQTWTLTGNSTPTDSLTDGQLVKLLIDDGTSYTITWTMVDQWIGGSAPTLATTGYTSIILEKIGSTLYASTQGDYS